jgi:predicted dehydrogenase
MLPALKSTKANIKHIVSSGGVNGTALAKKHNISQSTTDYELVLDDKDVDLIMITTRHNLHAEMVIKALNKGKHVFVEKPLALNNKELKAIEESYKNSNGSLMIGFNRRFSPQIQKMKSLLNNISDPKAIVMTVNAGKIPGDHWTQDLKVGGGRIIGEACHFIDLLRFLIGKIITSYQIRYLDSLTKDTATIQLSFQDGSIGSIHYFANGPKSLPKERIEIFSRGSVLQLDNYRKLIGFAWPGFSKMNLWQQNKGQKACAKAFIDSVSKGDKSPIPIEEIFEISKISVELANQ